MTDPLAGRDLRALLAEATRGPWIVGSDGALRDGVWSESAITMADSGDGRPSHLVAWCHSDWRAEEDAALIVAAVNALPALLDVVEAARRYTADPVGKTTSQIMADFDAIREALARLKEDPR